MGTYSEFDLDLTQYGEGGTHPASVPSPVVSKATEIISTVVLGTVLTGCNTQYVGCDPDHEISVDSPCGSSRVNGGAVPYC